jgi:hypothetical protein
MRFGYECQETINSVLLLHLLLLLGANILGIVLITLNERPMNSLGLFCWAS